MTAGPDDPRTNPARRTRVPRTVGILNIIFGSSLMLCGMCYGFQMAILPLMKPMMDMQQQQMQGMMKAAELQQRNQQLAGLSEQEESAQTEEERAAIQAERARLEAEPLPEIPQMDMMAGMDDRRVLGYVWTDLLSGILLNTLLVVGGIGLLSAREWARRLTMIVASIKIARLAILCAILLLVVVPIWSEAWGKNIGKFVEAAPAGAAGRGPTAEELASLYGIMMSVTGVAMFVLGSIYPGIVLWLLSRPHVRAACRRED